MYIEGCITLLVHQSNIGVTSDDFNSAIEVVKETLGFCH